jgi:hypothetical protein
VVGNTDRANDPQGGLMDTNIALLIGRVIAGCFFIMNGFNHFAKTPNDGRVRQEQKRTCSRARRGRFGRASLLRRVEPAPWQSTDYWSGPIGDFPLSGIVRYPQFLDSARSTSEDGGDDTLPQEHGHPWFAVDDLGHPKALAHESWALKRKPESL